jgi:cytochrome c peroxidase
MRCPRLVLVILVAALPAWSRAPAPYAQRLDVPRLSALGRAIFFDAELSPSGAVACASCHDPKHAYGPPDADALRLGFRAAPSLRYLNTLPAFTEHHFDNDGDDSIDLGPTGGHTWDGRAASAREQARLPLSSRGCGARRMPRSCRRCSARPFSTDPRRRSMPRCWRSRSFNSRRRTSIRSAAASTRCCAARPR